MRLSATMRHPLLVRTRYGLGLFLVRISCLQFAWFVRCRNRRSDGYEPKDEPPLAIELNAEMCMY